MILLVDDDPEFLERSFATLNRPERIWYASDADQAMNVVRRAGAALNLGLVDLDLPRTSGFELIRQLKQFDSRLPLIAISGVFSSAVLESATAFGAGDTLPKPVTGSWNPVIDRMLCRPSQSNATPPPVVVDTAAHPFTVEHRVGTGHFRCLCGARLTFSPDSSIYTQLSDVHRGERLKTGVCPACRVVHVVKW
jgi:CheY-like chemotaxis protein